MRLQKAPASLSASHVPTAQSQLTAVLRAELLGPGLFAGSVRPLNLNKSYHVVLRTSTITHEKTVGETVGDVGETVGIIVLIAATVR